MPDRPVSLLDPKTPVLIVDDNVQYATLLSRMLQGAFGFTNITMVDNVDEALALIKSDQNRFRLLFVDYHFPSGHTGGELLTALKSEGLLHGKVAFLITSDPTIEIVKAAALQGALGVVTKPFDREELHKQLALAQRALDLDEGQSF